MAVRKKKPWGSIKPSVGYGVEWGDSITKGLVGYWLFNEGAGNKVYDIIQKNTGTFSNAPTWNPGIFGQAIKFVSASSQSINLNAPPALNLSGDYSISAWINLTSTAGGRAEIFADMRSDSASGQFAFGVNNVAGKLELLTNGNATVAVAGATALTTGRWYHVVGTCKATTFTIYINANLDAQTTTAGAHGTQAGAAIGRLGAFAGLYFPGLIDNVRVYNRALSASEIMRLYSEPFAGVQAPKRRWLTSPGITFDAASNSGYQAAASTYNWSHTCTGSNLYLTVGISMLSLAQTVSGITYNSVAMTFLGAQNSVTGAARVELWGLIAPATGSNSIAVTLTGAIASAGNASSYAGVHQASPTEGFNSAQATNVGAADATVNVTTVANNDWCVDILATDDTAVTVGAGQTQTGNVTGAGGSGTMSYEGPQTPAGTVTMSWTNVAALATWSIGSIALRPVAAGGLGGLFRFFFM